MLVGVLMKAFIPIYSTTSKWRAILLESVHVVLNFVAFYVAYMSVTDLQQWSPIKNTKYTY